MPLLKLDPPSQSPAFAWPYHAHQSSHGAQAFSWTCPKPADLKHLVCSSTFLLNTLGNKWCLSHRNKNTSKCDNRYSCSQESPPITPAPRIAHWPLSSLSFSFLQQHPAPGDACSPLCFLPLYAFLLPNSYSFSVQSCLALSSGSPSNPCPHNIIFRYQGIFLTKNICSGKE